MRQLLPALILSALIIVMAGCTAQEVKPPQPVEPQPTDLQWYSKGCEIYGAFSFSGTDKQLVFKVPVDACGRGE